MIYPHLPRYTRPAYFIDYAGLDRRQYYVAGSRHRDSDTLAQSNFRSLLRALGGESETVLVLRDTHWAVGWTEALYIHESDTGRLELADQLLARLENYPVLDEDDWTALEYTTAADYWAQLSLKERVDLCRRHRCSIFAARRDDLPEDSQGGLISALADGC